MGKDLDAESSNINKNQHIRDLLRNLEFFKEHSLMQNAGEKIAQLKEFIKNGK